jgi:hypothetical protein
MITFDKNDNTTCDLVKSEAQNAAHTASMKATNEAVKLAIYLAAFNTVMDSTRRAADAAQAAIYGAIAEAARSR